MTGLTLYYYSKIILKWNDENVGKINSACYLGYPYFIDRNKEIANFDYGY